jgi:hypothetical protein
MHHGVTARKRRPQRFGIGQVAHMRLAADAFKIFQVAALADEKPESRAFRREGLSYMMAYEAGRACEEDFHGLASQQISEPAT